MKTIERQRRKQVEILKVLKPVERQQGIFEGIFPKDLENSEIKSKLNEIKELE